MGLCETIIMRCKQTACPVPPADILISLPKAKMKKRKSARDEERGRDKEAEGEEKI